MEGQVDDLQYLKQIEELQLKLKDTEKRVLTQAIELSEKWDEVGVPGTLRIIPGGGPPPPPAPPGGESKKI